MPSVRQQWEQSQRIIQNGRMLRSSPPGFTAVNDPPPALGTSWLASYPAVAVDLRRRGARSVALWPPLGHQHDAGRHKFEASERQRLELIGVAHPQLHPR